MAAVPSIGRAARVEGMPAPEADLTRALYEQYGSQIFRYCLHQLGSREEAEDAVQSTFLNAFRGIKRGIVPELESAWLFKIAQNVCLSRRRSTWRRDRIESPTDFELVEELTPAPSRRADELMGLQDVLETLPENQRRAILLREWQGLSYHEIADELELSQSAVETLIFRARRALAQGLEEPPAPKKRRLARGADWGNVLAGLKSLLLGGGAAVKVAATVAVVSATTVAATAPVVESHSRPSHATPAASVSAKTPSVTSAATSLAVNLSAAVSGPAHHPAAVGALLSAATQAGTSTTAAANPPVDATVPAAEAPATPPPVAGAPAPAPVAAAPSAPASGSDNGQGDTSTVVAKPVQPKKDGSATTTVVAPPTSSSGGDTSSNSPAPEQTPVLAPVTTTLSAPPAGDNAGSASLVLPPTLTKKLDSPPATTTSPVTSTSTTTTPTTTTPSSPTITVPTTGLPPTLSVQPKTTSGSQS